MIGNQVAVFADANYIYSRISENLVRKKDLIEQKFCISSFKKIIIQECDDFAPKARFLRIYWYDGVARDNSPSNDQLIISRHPDVKLRLGRKFIRPNGKSEQKGVDFLLCSDLIKLSEHGAISDAIILTGDGDFRAAVETAQSFGVRIHLVCIGQDRFNSQLSDELYEEADTRNFFGLELIRTLVNF